MSAGAIASALATAAAVALLRPCFARRAWLDAARGEEGLRKRQDRPVPPVGGPALALGLAVLLWTGALELPTPLPAGLRPPSAIGAALALGLAFLVGLVDDLRADGLRPLAKLAGQLAAGLVLGLSAAPGGGAGEGLASAVLWTLGALCATNLWNTFDNADGAATGLAALALAPAPASLPVLAFLPWNLAPQRGASAPRAYLGDSGSHLLGMLCLLQPAAWPAFLLPALDLARLCWVRLRSGSRPWRGDRRHLAHRLQAAGLGRIAVLAALLLLASPALLLGGEVGFAGTVGGFALAVVLTPEPRAGALARAGCGDDTPPPRPSPPGGAREPGEDP